MISTDEGIQIDSSDEQTQKAETPRIEIFEPPSIVNFRRLSHFSKHPSEMISTDDGIQIDSSDKHRRKAYFPRTESREPDSNLTDKISLL
jgi:hypothetical protein